MMMKGTHFISTALDEEGSIVTQINGRQIQELTTDLTTVDANLRTKVKSR
ncbi:hypothetical protein ACFVS2_34040 [Brevibacillus sp. NPDC058079]